MSRLQEFYVRHSVRFSEAGVDLWCNSPGGLDVRTLNPERSAQWHCQDYIAAENFRRLGVDARFSVLPGVTKPPQAIVLQLPREKARLRMMSDWAACHLSPAGRLFVAGENRAGIKSCPRVLENHFGTVRKMDSARHCSLYEATQPAPQGPFTLRTHEASWSYSFGGRELQARSLPGVFSHGSTDAGTALLLETLQPMNPGGRVLDMGCGAGLIAMALISQNEQTTATLADTSALALHSSEMSLAANGFRADVLPSDGLSGVSGDYDLIISNPPFHQGHHQDTKLGPALFQGAGNFLRSGGQLIMVVNRHLPYGRWLRDSLGEQTVLNANGAYQVLAFHPH